ncbi:hypothetical protein V1520DRAFT_131832 [Lipomyces starkeyi]|uniref:Uncharacterized protein n=1 Tax=Lipomyces starkeyi NRRL Y-11557 TaxID=675824 RepID=A0A1E3Q702_LIPST|nr:hypothetical protein LIPSTDRAFT_308194 [Lipomyces starkeyi NRRL Y-11557]
MSKDAVLTFEASGELDLKAGVIVGLWGKIWTMIRKRIIVSRRHPFPTFCVVLIPIVVGGILTRFSRSYEGAWCYIENTVGVQGYKSVRVHGLDKYDLRTAVHCDGVSFWSIKLPCSLDKSVEYLRVSRLVETFAAFVDAVHTNYSTLLPGGIYFNSPVTLSYRVDGGSKLSSARNGIIFSLFPLNMV